MSDRMWTGIPILPLKDIVVLPGMLVHLDINREISTLAVKKAIEGDGTIFITAQKNIEVDDPSFYDLYAVGVIAKIRQEVKIGETSRRVMISTKTRASLVSVSQTKPYLSGDVLELITEDDALFDDTEREALRRNLRELYEEYLSENPRASRSAIDKVRETDDLEKLIDVISMQVNMGFLKRQEVLECMSIERRYELLGEYLLSEVNIYKIREEYRSRVREEVDKNQKEYFLREQMRVIKSELGDDDGEDFADKYEKQLEDLECSDEIREAISTEIKHLRAIPTSSSEHVVSSSYIETLLSLPWDKAGEDNDDLNHAEQVLDEDHYGLEKVKERILEFLAVRALTKKGDSPIICLVGPPGTGKTSIAKSVARALEKPYVRVCLGGVRDEAEIRGHRRTYVGALPGSIIDGMKRAAVKNPLILLDEIDKVGSDARGDTSSALLEVLDPEQNKNFKDHYVDLPVDLSDVLFICTANSTDTIARPLLDRMEIIRVSGYTENEKFHIAKDYLVAKQYEKNGLKKKNLVIGDGAIREIIGSYTKEAGVRELERMIGKICRKTAKMMLSKKNDEEKSDSISTIRVSKKNITDFLGKKKYHSNPANKKDDIGIVRGLAWTEVGGDTLEIEVNTMPGEGQLKLTGQLGDVMQESAQIALSLVRSMLPKQDEYFKTHDFHLHVPEGAVPKDGPSAGVTMATAIYSAVTKRKVRSKTAMTGEITLRGRVLPIGGLKEKLLAARIAGMDTVLVPGENRPDIDELEDEITDGIDIRYVTKVDDVLKSILAN